jgi:hypothetical protein
VLHLIQVKDKEYEDTYKYRLSPVGDHTGKYRVRNKKADHWTTPVSKAVKGPRVLAEGFTDYISL